MQYQFGTIKYDSINNEMEISQTVTDKYIKMNSQPIYYYYKMS